MSGGHVTTLTKTMKIAAVCLFFAATASAKGGNLGIVINKALYTAADCSGNPSQTMTSYIKFNPNSICGIITGGSYEYWKVKPIVPSCRVDVESALVSPILLALPQRLYLTPPALTRSRPRTQWPVGAALRVTDPNHVWNDICGTLLSQKPP
jgi:hypothetical protein